MVPGIVRYDIQYTFQRKCYSSVQPQSLIESARLCAVFVEGGVTKAPTLMKTLFQYLADEIYECLRESESPDDEVVWHYLWYDLSEVM